MAVKKGFMQTEVGLIPEDWLICGFDALASIPSGQVDPKQEPFRSMVLVAPDHIESGTGRLLKKETAADQKAISGKYLFAPKDVLYSKIRPYLRKATLADFDGLCSADMYPLRPSERTCAGYLFGVILGHRFSKYADSVSVRSGMPKINREELSAFFTAIPPTLTEQEAIAGALSDADAWIESLEQLIAKKRQIKQGAIQELLTGKRRLPGFSGAWLRRQLKELCIDGGLVRGPFGGTLKKEFFVDKGIAVYEQRNAIYRTSTDFRYFINQSKFAELRRFEIRHGDFIVSCSGTIGRIYRVPLGSPVGVINQALLLIRVNESIIVPSFFYHYFAWDCFQAFIIDNTQGGAMQNLVGMSVFKATEISTPSLAEQSAIAVVLSDMDTEIESLESKLAKAREIKQGMMQELLTGRIRLV